MDVVRKFHAYKRARCLASRSLETPLPPASYAPIEAAVKVIFCARAVIISKYIV